MTKVFTDASALQSAAASLATSHPSSVAMASSLEARASEFDASVSAQVEKARTSAEKVLKSVSGSGNAIDDVSITGLPTATKAGKRLAVVTITNRTRQPASFAVQIDFIDSSGKTVESTVVSATDVPPGEKATPLASGTSTASAPKIAKAQRY
ncbi:hypothetical protein [Actinacidiphila soli]|uniref:hypothetical protein n=1 Tax=Actinacidiphila soli TaxID=2487275 RepID=UPI000FCB9F0C|nr:hypothetical protein [Actinacidiphila soli]